MDVYFRQRANLCYIGRVLAGLALQPGRVRFHAVDWLRRGEPIVVDTGDRLLVIDLTDHSDQWDLPLLDACDLYVKRSVRLPLPPKVVPFGLNCASRSNTSAFKALAALRKCPVKDLYRYLVTPHWRDLEYGPDEPVEMQILIQVRVWEAYDAPGDEGISEERIALMRALRREFGTRVVGGMVPTPLAYRICPDLITTAPTRQPQFIRWGKRAAIGIYSRGLFDSIGFKMAEYLASSKCIVGDPLKNLVPALIPQQTYTSIDQCLSICDRLLSNPQEVRDLRHASWEYYQLNVEPAAHMANILRLGAESVGAPNENNESTPARIARLSKDPSVRRSGIDPGRK